jgi:hypothetical protein
MVILNSLIYKVILLLIKNFVNFLYYLFAEKQKIYVMVKMQYTYKELKKSKDLRIKNILSKIDYFIDGLYDESKRDTTLKLRGSSNQNVYHRIKGKLKKIDI